MEEEDAEPEEDVEDEEGDLAAPASRRRPPSSSARRGRGHGGTAAKPSPATSGSQRGPAPRRTASRRTASPTLSMRSGGGSGTSGRAAAADASGPPVDLLHIDGAKLQVAATALVRSLEVKNTSAQPAIVDSKDVAVWLEWLMSKIKMPDIQEVMKAQGLPATVGTKLVKTVIMLKHLVAHL